jgi:succinoglycan biosynthesis transport protein ExoP
MYQLSGKADGKFVPDPAQVGSEDDFRRIVGALRRRWRTFLAIFGVFFGIALIYALLWPRSYVTTVEMITGNSAQNNNGLNSDLPVLNALVAAAGVQSVETYATLLVDNDAAATVIKDLGLKTDVYDLLHYKIAVAPVTNTQIVTLQATWNEPKMSAAIANDFARVLIQRQRDIIASQSVQAMDYLSQQIPVAEANMNRADAELARFQSEHTIGDIAAQTQSTVGQYTDNATKMAQLQVDIAQATASLNDVSGQMGSNGRTIAGGTSIAQNPVITQLTQQLAQVNVQLAAARKQYTDRHPTVVALEQQQQQLQLEITRQPSTYVASSTVVPNPIFQQLEQQAAQFRTQIASDQSQIQALRVQQDVVSSRVRQLPLVTQQLANRQREASLAESVFSTMKQRYADAEVAKTLALSNVAVNQPAEARFAQPKPNIPLTIGLGLVLGIMLALSGVFIIDFFDNSIKDENDVRRVLPLPILASVPQLDASDRRAQAKLPMLRVLTIEAYLQLVTSLRYASDKPLRSIAITSPTQGDGKSTVALSTAIAMAEIRPRVLLVDADMRRPTIHLKLDIPQGPGLTDLLVGVKSMDDVIVKTKYAGLDVLPSGTHAPNPVTLIQSPHFDETIKALVERYEVVIIDAPAVLPMVDAAAIGAKTDAMVMVIAAGKTDTKSAERAMQRLSFVERVNVLGVVLNQATPNARESQYFLNAGEQNVPLTGDLETD